MLLQEVYDSCLKPFRKQSKRQKKVLPGEAARPGETDTRWQAIMLIEDFVKQDPTAIMPFVLKWGVHEEEDLRAAIACLLLERLLEFHFETIFPQVEQTALASPLFADTFLKAWKLGQSEQPENSIRFDALCLRLKPSLKRF